MAMAVSNRKAWTTGLAWWGLALLAALVLATLSHDVIFHRRTAEATPEGSAAVAARGPATPESQAMATTVILPEGKFRVAGIKTGPAAVTRQATEVGVPGRIEANIDHQIEIRPRASGVVREVHVVLSQKVKKGDVLVVLDSPDIGTARLNLHSRQRDLWTVRTEAAWKNEVAANVAKLIPELRAGTPAEKINGQYANRPLGANRALLLEAYSRFEIASHEAEKTSGLHRERIVGEHPAFVAMHTREGAQANFEAELEQVTFDAKQQKLIADQQVKNAEAAVIDAAQRLRMLGVAEDIDALLAHPEAAVNGTADQDVTTYRIVAPFDGTIITKNAVPSQKAETNDILFTLADLSSVWVRANVPESEFASIQALQGGSVHVTATAYPDRAFEATLFSIGSVVDPTTRTVPILAETPNPDDLLKLGMFVRISLDSATSEQVLTVPDSAVVEIDGRTGVFLPAATKGTQGHAYTFHAVRVGRASNDRRVVLAGLDKGASVVTSGAFFLKSELILQNETEED
jgi:cobalt-zinc-cadmium efflux system membrane fusion protein